MWEHENILVCTDFSAESMKALKVAENIRKKSNSVIHVLHVIEYPVEWRNIMGNDFLPHYLDDRFDAELFSLSQERLQKTIEEAGIKAIGHVSYGVAYSAIIEMIQQSGIKLLIIGHRGISNTPFRVGSLAEKLVAASPVPILIMKGPLVFEKICGLFDPTNPEEEVLKVASKLAIFFKSKLEILSLLKEAHGYFPTLGKVSFPTEERKEHIHEIKHYIKNLLTDRPETLIRVETSVEKNIAFHLNKILVEDHADLAVMKRHHYSLNEGFIIGSETRRMLELFKGNLFIQP